MSAAARPLVAVLLGTDCHRFDRLITWVEELSGDPRLEWFVQHGSTPLPRGVNGAPMVEVAELQLILMRAAAVVTHGGPGLIMESRSWGHRPIVVARDPARHEHVDAHQQKFVARIAATGLCRKVDSQEELRLAVDSAVTVVKGSQQETGTDLSFEVANLVESLVRTRREPARSRRVAWHR